MTLPMFLYGQANRRNQGKCPGGYLMKIRDGYHLYAMVNRYVGRWLTFVQDQHCSILTHSLRLLRFLINRMRGKVNTGKFVQLPFTEDVHAAVEGTPVTGVRGKGWFVEYPGS